MSNESAMLSNHLILYCLLLFLPSVFPSLRVFSNESALHIRWPKYWSFSFTISPANKESGLISFKTDLFDLLPVWGTLKSLLQHHSFKASTLRHSAFFVLQLSHLCITTGKTRALARWTFVSKVMPLLFNTLILKYRGWCSWDYQWEWQTCSEHRIRKQIKKGVSNGTSLGQAMRYHVCVGWDSWELTRYNPTLSPWKAQTY